MIPKTHCDFYFYHRLVETSLKFIISEGNIYGHGKDMLSGNGFIVVSIVVHSKQVLVTAKP